MEQDFGRFAAFGIGLRELNDTIFEQFSLRIEDDHLAAGPDAGIDCEDGFSSERGRHQQFPQVVREDADGLIGGTGEGAEAGLHLLLQMNNGMTEPELVRRAAEAGVGVYPLSSYYLAPGTRSALPTLVMGYARMRGEDMAPAFSLLRKAWALDRP